jgi:hypothetical protein
MLRPSKKQIQYPAAEDVFAAGAAVGEDGIVGAAGFFERVGENRHVGEAALGVDRLREGGDVRRAPGGIEPDGAVRIPEDVTN